MTEPSEFALARVAQEGINSEIDDMCLECEDPNDRYGNALRIATLWPAIEAALSSGEAAKKDLERNVRLYAKLRKELAELRQYKDMRDKMVRLELVVEPDEIGVGTGPVKWVAYPVGQLSSMHVQSTPEDAVDAVTEVSDDRQEDPR